MLSTSLLTRGLSPPPVSVSSTSSTSRQRTLWRLTVRAPRWRVSRTWTISGDADMQNPPSKPRLSKTSAWRSAASSTRR